ncbi:MAG: bifunctional aspartate transaminase/aspartate 4-decarboxylase [Candidatus Margulisbacteria bacterium]|nr:bifunctional aspartate transaminase/aspartate 4-decarboxylase [Candidatus Margulisiibacteriota bacterium]MBU1022257.1 bifunctional aspartate transaminase/aspartate 4-decarboxylase [Candidatus Margulisiibacteriota bacterium]MBU1729304.1 bifunctional aspartate transaminase/aspartate 4-decarboxylase [Candidatus Margulisiibacteriota bacterium]MBU1955577.1 bifunctional aspartate transaminase/aspartate 4-decarboxylase [Candidatus Margulisiibacteriota bacterium]
MQRSAREKKYLALSPFELKDKLISMATDRGAKMMLNAGRGNPNWVTITPRRAFADFMHFALQESESNPHRRRLGNVPVKKGIAKRLREFIKGKEDQAGPKFIGIALDYVVNEMKIDADSFVLEMCDAILGDHYPTPDRMLSISEQIVHKYLEQEMFKGKVPGGKFDLFATEGGTAAMDYIFNSLMENHLTHKGDKIALGTPIFTPYIEIPRLNDYKFVEINILQDENNDWQYPDAELKKLEDPKIKAFFLVHPSNPSSVAMHQKSLNKVAQLVKTKRKDLILLTDDVYGTFVNEFKSLAAIAPLNTILVYSFSKYFGATGWRLGVIGLHENNVFDKMIKKLPLKFRKELNKRYSTVVTVPENMKLIDRMVADSRSVALHHTSGLSTPQQVLMVFFSLYCLTDKKGAYKEEAQSIVYERFETLYKNIGIPCPRHPLDAHYYTMVDVPKLAKQRYGDEFAKWLVKNHEPIDYVWRLADEYGVVLMDGGGFDAPNMSVRVSLANLQLEAYAKIGKAISELLEKYNQEFKAGR